MSNRPTPSPQVPLITSDLIQLFSTQPPAMGVPLIADTTNKPNSAAHTPRIMPAHQLEDRGPRQTAPNNAPHTPPQKHRLTILGTWNGGTASSGKGGGIPRPGKAR